MRALPSCFGKFPTLCGSPVLFLFGLSARTGRLIMPSSPLPLSVSLPFVVFYFLAVFPCLSSTPYLTGNIEGLMSPLSHMTPEFVSWLSDHQETSCKFSEAELLYTTPLLI
ncbi:hypothetical protein ILYODFUR_014686 [Ilyodon furcidens]|uniref:Uncharacterized protein n=1 Tax=Ilyodon furcidens TaxID=33524 RepID=A0ABV0V5R2_9TELE